MPVISVDGIKYVPETNIAFSGDAATLGEAFLELRKNCNMTLDKAADRAGMSKSHLWSIEKGRTEPSLWIAGELARLYGADLRALAGMRRA